MPAKSSPRHDTSAAATSARRVVKSQTADSSRSKNGTVTSAQVMKANKAMVRAWKKIAARSRA